MNTKSTTAGKDEAPLALDETITHRIALLRGKKVLLDADLAALYGVQTRRLNEQVRRNRDRFPGDFIFELTQEEFADLKSQTAISSWGGRRTLPMAFTEHGAIMAATVLSSPRAVQMSVYIVRAFVQLRELALSHQALAKRLETLEDKFEQLSGQHDAFSHDTRAQLRQLIDALRAMTAVAPTPPKRPIGFLTTPEEKKSPKARGSRGS